MFVYSFQITQEDSLVTVASVEATRDKVVMEEITIDQAWAAKVEMKWLARSVYLHQSLLRCSKMLH